MSWYVLEAVHVGGAYQQVMSSRSHPQTILLLSLARALVLMTGQGEVPTDAQMEQHSLAAYRALGKGPKRSLSKKEFLEVSH